MENLEVEKPNNLLKLILKGFGVLFVLVFAVMYGLKVYTKSHSPEDIANGKLDDLMVRVEYCQPSKRGREIFGNVVKYNEVWRTGANEATLIELSEDVLIEGVKLKAGIYSLYTIPTETNWVIIFNSQTGQWGTTYNIDNDVLKVTAMSQKLSTEIELFTIRFENADDKLLMILEWDTTRVTLPISLD